MAYIPYIEEQDAGPELSELYEELRAPEGDLDYILKIHSFQPASLRGHHDYYKTIMYGKSDLTRVQREMIGVVVSAANDCHY